MHSREEALYPILDKDADGQPLDGNPVNRYLINASMLPGLKNDVDGGLTIYIQKRT